MKGVASILLLAFSVSALTEIQYQEQFIQWMRQNQKSFTHEEFHQRYATFKSNLDLINAHNADASKGFTLALNRFAHMSSVEFNNAYNGFTIPLDRKGQSQVARNIKVPISVNWAADGAATPVKNQLNCDSSWAFSTTGSVEGCHFITTGTLVSLSEQNLMDCSVSYGNQGCNGGHMDSAFQYIIANNGIETEASYPYVGYGPNTCQYNAANCGSIMATFTDVTSGSESALQTAVIEQPVSVAIDASQYSFQFYFEGIYYEPHCSNTTLNLAMLAVGYGVSDGEDYWLLKNSWGTDWGLKGYMWLARNRQNNCGVATAASYPSGCKNCS
eukprot:TRINITY_DN2696_c0_g1_i1.p1 TRINITY_DN2696_c0_g1~~TRINITY_DN2696_c0_g1_i1.p1  ORF type:complete len:357 (-),score=90.61 TRINITY_DN2696_c0_g1_i1:13-999(-)